MSVKILTTILLALFVAAGCTSSSSSVQSATAAGYDVSLVTQPAPMQSGRLATVTIRVTETGGQALGGANVTFKGQHASMAHGAGATISTQEREPGVYSGGFTPTMGGRYTMTVTVDGPKGKGEKTIDAEVQ